MFFPVLNDLAWKLPQLNEWIQQIKTTKNNNLALSIRETFDELLFLY